MGFESPTTPVVQSCCYIDQLSNEVIILILQAAAASNFGEWHYIFNKQNPVFNFGLCCRRFQNLAEPVLFEKVKIKRQRLSSSSYTAPQQLLLKLFKRADLAAKVVLLDCEDFDSDYDSEYNLDVSCFEPADWDRIRSTISAASTNDDQYNLWIGRLEDEYWDAIMGLIFIILPNLQELDFHKWCGQSQIYQNIFKAAAERQKISPILPMAFSNLRKVSLSWWDDESGGMRLSCIETFAQLRSVISIEAWGVEEHDLEFIGLPGTEPLSPDLAFHTTDLVLRSVATPPYDLVELLRKFDRLKTLSYEQGMALGRGVEVQPPEIMEAIEHLTPCLESLTVSHLNLDTYVKTPYSIGNLQEFQRLKHLEAVGAMLVDNDNDEEEDEDEYKEETSFSNSQNLSNSLPSSLERLCVWYPNPEISARLAELMQERPELGVNIKEPIS